MKVTLKLGYRTQDNQRAYVQYADKQLPLAQCDSDNQSIEFTTRNCALLHYSYSVQQGEETINKEWRKTHSIPLGKGIKSLHVADRWCDISPNAPLHSSLFTESIFRRVAPKYASLEQDCLMVEVSVPIMRSEWSLVMVGSSPELGEWNVADGIVMCDGDHPYWRTPSLEITPELLASEYKFVIVDRIIDHVIAWEQGTNRNFAAAQGAEADAIFVTEREAEFSLPAWRGAGVAIPLFSLRSQESAGVGEFADLKKMVDWARMTDQKIIQILPINDTTMSGTWEDSYPYNANSIFALHPQYISLNSIGKLTDKKAQAAFEAEAKRLNALPKIDYEAVNKLKTKQLKKLYAQLGEKTLAKRDYQNFFADNSYWLESYALFSLLRDKYKTADFASWGDEALYSDELLEKYRTKHLDKLSYYYFVQYHLHCQLLDARAYALKNGVAFKGDIPIGVSRTSVDVWVNPRLFRLDSQAGAPPDDFSVLGQNWGFPTYNWEEMALDGYSWWQARFSKMAEYFDAYRIDHILGFFRIWEIPLDAIHGLLGYFNPALPFTPTEMRERYGFVFEQAYVEPAINSWLLYRIFGARAEEVTRKFLTPVAMDAYAFTSQYDTQVKVAAAVKGTDDEPLLDGLLSLFTEVLFIEDPHKAGHYHPRISAQHSYKFQAMNDYDRDCYNRMYNDFYYHLHNDYWRSEALKKLPALISATDMLTCGEDLGMIPHCVPEVMDREQILSLEIQRMPKDPALEFGEPWNYPYRSVCTTSTHDMNPLRAWLREDRETTERYFSRVLGVNHAMEEDCPAWICERIICQHLASPAMWVILPLQDWMSIDESLRAKDPEAERINVPSNSRHYWRYRMHCTIEELIGYEELNERIGMLTRGMA
ncbi:MAG: 4-alpha-glucanotransferase [Rikenellaceae bacterium]